MAATARRERVPAAAIPASTRSAWRARWPPNSVVSLFYYFSVAKALFLKDPSEKPALSQPLFAGLIAVLGLMTVYFGLMPGSIQELVTMCSLLGS